VLLHNRLHIKRAVHLRRMQVQRILGIADPVMTLQRIGISPLLRTNGGVWQSPTCPSRQNPSSAGAKVRSRPNPFDAASSACSPSYLKGFLPLPYSFNLIITIEGKVALGGGSPGRGTSLYPRAVTPSGTAKYRSSHCPAEAMHSKWVGCQVEGGEKSDTPPTHAQPREHRQGD
jgi:hypothetical protein